jgi:DNA-binding transcriptional LysR family regulator
MAALTIAFVPGVSPAKWARVWRDRMPDVELRLRAIGPGEVDAALAGDVDMVFARLPVSEEHNAIPLWTETPVVAAPKDSAIAGVESLERRDLVGETVLGGDSPVPEDVDAALDLVEAGAGVVVLPQSLFRAASRSGLVGRPLTDADGTRIALVWRDGDASELTEEFIGIVRGRTANSSRGSSADEQPEARPEKQPAPARPKTGPKQIRRTPPRTGGVRGGKRRRSR